MSVSLKADYEEKKKYTWSMAKPRVIEIEILSKRLQPTAMMTEENDVADEENKWNIISVKVSESAISLAQQWKRREAEEAAAKSENK